MPAEVTLDEVWKLFKETDQKLRETAERMRETDEKIREGDRRFNEKLDQLNRQIATQLAESRAIADRTSAQVERTSRNVDALTDRWGQFVEGMVLPAARTLFAARGIPVHEVHRRMSGTRGGVAMEIDLMVVNDGHAVVIEVKSKLRQSDVDRHIERLKAFKMVFPRYADVRVIGAVAAVEIPEQVALYAYRCGLFVMAQSGETMRLLNDDRFEPRSW